MSAFESTFSDIENSAKLTERGQLRTYVACYLAFQKVLRRPAF